MSVTASVRNYCPTTSPISRDGAFYGWSSSYYGQNVDPGLEDQRPDLVAQVSCLTMRSAPVRQLWRISFYDQDAFPA
jgi:glucose/arabinose dehydrogenase